jgi:hypothetical protein
MARVFWLALAVVVVLLSAAAVTVLWAGSGVSGPAVATGPGGCDGAESILAATRESRQRTVSASDPTTKAGELGTLIMLESPYESFEPAYAGRVTPFDAAAGQRFGDLAAFRLGYSRSFVAPGSYNTGEGFLTVEVYEFETPDAAVASLEQHLMSRCEDTAETFTIAALPDAVGISVRGSAPPVEDDVLFVRGQRRYLIRRGLAEPPDNHLETAELALAGSALAQ